MLRFPPFGLPAVMLTALVGCAPDYSPNTYASNAVQQVNKVEPAVVVGFRQVKISASGTVGAVSGGAAGGILGAQTDASGVGSALGALGGTIIGGLVGTTVEHAAGDTVGWEYIVRKSNGDLLSVTQRQVVPIPIGQKVLVITGNQARIVPDYSVALDPPPAPAAGTDKTSAGEKPTAASTPAATSHQMLSTPPNESAASVSPSSPTIPAAATISPPSTSASADRPPTPSSKPEAPLPVSTGSETTPKISPP